ncbi:transporter [Plantactinospora mayteni]|uniref:Transporter n=1 Tax=Plantactinospora mayteni TaxID=566021 RepID=A0ABQ4EG53_9ACTN|nr:ABC transporter permease subunit [Plantactinospora mayteni]GIG93705.1 transporter [Plantactinospora mayteni]
MIWLTWRQFRGQALVAVAVLAALATYLVVLGLRIRTAYEVNVDCAGCSVEAAKDVFESAYFTPLLLTGFLVVLVPGIVGAFWGAPLLAREFETGTHRLVWNQSVSRTRWLAVKLGLVTLAGVILTGALSLLLTWAASPYDKLFDGRFDPLLFPTRNIAPLGYAVFAVVAGVTVGLLVRRTVPAMAILLAGFVLLQILMPTLVRPHLQPAVTERVAWTAANAKGLLINGAGEVWTEEVAVPGAWVLTSGPQMLDAAGNPASQEQIESCPRAEPSAHMACIETKGFQMTLSYQPADRYWTFQWLEVGIYLLLAGLLAGFVFWRIPRGLN